MPQACLRGFADLDLCEGTTTPVGLHEVSANSQPTEIKPTTVSNINRGSFIIHFVSNLDSSVFFLNLCFIKIITWFYLSRQRPSAYGHRVQIPKDAGMPRGG